MMQAFHFDPWPPPCSSKSIKVQSAPSSSNSKKNTEQHTHTHANITYLMAWSLDVTWACSLSKFNRSHLLGGRRLVQGCRFLAASLCHRSHFSDLQFLCQPGNWQSTHRSPETWVEDIPGTQKSYTQYAHVDMADIPPYRTTKRPSPSGPGRPRVHI